MNTKSVYVVQCINYETVVLCNDSMQSKWVILCDNVLNVCYVLISKNKTKMCNATLKETKEGHFETTAK